MTTLWFPILILVAVGLFYMGIALNSIVTLLKAVQKAGASQGWPTASGSIISSVIESHRQATSNKGTYRTIYEPKISYRYQANGQPYQSSRVNFDVTGGYNSREEAEDIAQKYTPGGAVTIFYNPEQPAEAVLERTGETRDINKSIKLVVFELFVVGVVAGVALALLRVAK